jgi:hypothetical protein
MMPPSSYLWPKLIPHSDGEETVNIASSSAATISAVMPKAPESKEAPGPDHDGDGDDKGAAVQSATAPGVGKTVDVKA